jgi:hypothetical protein
MNKKTWWIIALALAIGFSLLYKNSDDQPIIMDVVKFVRPSTPAVVETGAVVDTWTVATGAEVAPTADAVVAPEAEVAPTADAVVAPEAEVVVDAAAQ